MVDCKRLAEFFEAEDGRLSMTRLAMFGAFWPASYILLINAKGSNVGDILGWYLGAFVIGYVGGKTTDIFMTQKANPQGVRRNGKSARLGIE